MAIVNSLAIGKSVKSAGNLTYKVVRGRTIASQRITENKSNTIKQQSQRDAFGKVSQAMQLCQAYISMCYEKSKYGSARNEFQKTNKGFTLGNLVGEIKEGIVSLTDGLTSALSLPSGGKRELTMISKGSLSCIVSMPYAAVTDGSYSGINAINGNVTYTFPSGVKVTDLTLRAVGLIDNQFITATVSANAEGGFDLSSTNEDLNSDLSKFSVEVTSQDGVVSSVSIVNDSLEISRNAPFLVIIPSVGNKVPNTFACYYQNTQEPEP